MLYVITEEKNKRQKRETTTSYDDDDGCGGTEGDISGKGIQQQIIF